MLMILRWGGVCVHVCVCVCVKTVCGWGWVGEGCRVKKMPRSVQDELTPRGGN